jgi:hypothetical protein
VGNAKIIRSKAFSPIGVHFAFSFMLMKSLPIILTLAGLLLLSSAAARAQCVVEGRVKLPKPHSGDVANKRYSMNGDPLVIQPDPPAAVVFLEGNFPAPSSLPRRQMAQKNIAFVSPLLAVFVGTTVEFPNEDDTYHNIFSYSKPKRFDLGRYRGEERPIPSQVFDKPGVVALHCDIHEHMHAVILVLETPHFVTTDPEGRYRLANLPAGRYKLKAWIDSRTTKECEVDLKPGAALHVDFP